MLRTLLVLALLANGLFFAWGQGWLAPHWPPPRHGEREPERLAAQLRPELVTVLPLAAAPGTAATAAAGAEAVGCLQAGPFDEVELAAAEATLLQAQLPAGSWVRAPADPRAAGSSRPARTHWLRAERADGVLQARLRALPPQALSGGFGPCR